jgi:hypothetical protein
MRLPATTASRRAGDPSPASFIVWHGAEINIYIDIIKLHIDFFNMVG